MVQIYTYINMQYILLNITNILTGWRCQMLDWIPAGVSIGAVQYLLSVQRLVQG